MSGYLAKAWVAPVYSRLVAFEAGHAAIHDDVALAVEGVGHPLAHDSTELHEVDADLISGGRGHGVVEVDDHDALFGGFFENRIEGRFGGGIDEDRVDLLRDHVIDRGDLGLHVRAGIDHRELHLILVVFCRVGFGQIDHLHPPLIADV